MLRPALTRRMFRARTSAPLTAEISLPFGRNHNRVTVRAALLSVPDCRPRTHLEPISVPSNRFPKGE
jgi:hypothetical protein